MSNNLHALAKTLDSRLCERAIGYDDMEHLLKSFKANALELELLKAQGFPLESNAQAYFLHTATTPYTKQRFCFVDIETTGARPQESQIIEIGAIMYENGEIVGKFDEFIYAPFVPESITQITGITAPMLEDARPAKAVLQDFRAFLGQSVFVAHNVGFDYSFISHELEHYGLGSLLNHRLCTIDLARRTILSKRYSLQYLNEFLGINTPSAHRAYADALTALKVFEIAHLCLPSSIYSTQDLLAFSRAKHKAF
ncbi:MULTISPECIES: 3'-5' exonuclease [Helicobacter]|nr:MULTISPECIES: 3'-5' exonuclease [Helicobacter]MDL0080932.1 3'-5' exonuclease [Helicobacter sp. CPD2-1]MDL0081953.1 3'-5' exonuclease [Helicobacter sp. XJK30-2]